MVWFQNLWLKKKLNIPASDFIETKAYEDYEEFRKLEVEVKNQMTNEQKISIESAIKLIELNPDFWESWYLAGEIYYQNEEYKKAVIHFKQAMKREITTTPDVGQVEKMIKKSYRKL